MMLLVLEVLHLIVGAEQEQNKLRAQYAYHELQENLPKRSKAYDVVLLEGQPYRKLVEINGKPLSPKEAKTVEADMLKTSKQRRRGTIFKRTYRMNIGNFADLEKTHELSLEENVITATPKTRAPYRHRITYNPKTFVVLAHEAELIGPGTELKPGTIVRRFFSKEQDEAWLLRRMEIDFKVTFASGKQINSFTNYRKFDVASTITFADPQ